MTHEKSLVGSCIRKSRYNSETKAQQIRAKCERLRPGTSLRVYYCGLCDGYHLTKVNAS